MPHVSERRAHSINNNLRRKLSSEAFKEKKQDESSTDDEEQDDVDQYKTFDFTYKEMLHHMGDIYSLCKETFNPKYPSVLLYMPCGHVDLSWRQSDDFFTNIGAMSIFISHYNSQTFLNEDLSDFTSDGRGGKRGSDFWMNTPNLRLWLGSSLWRAAIVNRRTSQYKNWRNMSMRNSMN